MPTSMSGPFSEVISVPYSVENGEADTHSPSLERRPDWLSYYPGGIFTRCRQRGGGAGRSLPVRSTHPSDRTQARFAPNAVILGDLDIPLKISKFIKDIHSGFQLLNLKNDSLRRKSDGLKYSVRTRSLDRRQSNIESSGQED